jgi:hypothetical protein
VEGRAKWIKDKERLPFIPCNPLYAALPHIMGLNKNPQLLYTDKDYPDRSGSVLCSLVEKQFEATYEEELRCTDSHWNDTLLALDEKEHVVSHFYWTHC